MSNGRLKSAYELAMERLSQRDSSMKKQVLSDETKVLIADIRSEYDAKIAEREIMFRSRTSEMSMELSGPELIVRQIEVENDYKNSVAVLKLTMEDKIKKARQGI
ncbi:hypothetical protein K8T06_14790 [bacterium]|nr:hypothetical protein [bacterium]